MKKAIVYDSLMKAHWKETNQLNDLIDQSPKET